MLVRDFTVNMELFKWSGQMKSKKLLAHSEGQISNIDQAVFCICTP